MKILLTAINAKYIHSNLAVYSLQAYAEAHGHKIDRAEYTINNQLDDILEKIYRQKPDVLLFSCYIWNVEYVRELAAEFHKLRPEVPIWVGGPEASFETERFLKENPAITGIMMGEGERTLTELCTYFEQYKQETQLLTENSENVQKGTEVAEAEHEKKSGSLAERNEELLGKIDGISYRRADGTVKIQPLRSLLPMDELPFCYANLKDFEHRIIYYESSRGCPFNCSYCLSSVDKKLRFRSLPLVYKELQFFIDAKVPQVKFVDRTFNCQHEHAMEIWKYIKEHDNGITNFHFEISADLLREDELELISDMRPGLIQLEIGVQSTNDVTIREIHRTMCLEKVYHAVNRVKAGGNIHQHLDLIAGLPFEDYQRFQQSFNDIYALHTQQLQLGFLKVLKGSYMYEHAAEYGLVYRTKPPYEVLASKWVSYDEMLEIRLVEEMLELHYNSGQFLTYLGVLEKQYDSAFQMFLDMGHYYRSNGYLDCNHNRVRRTEIVLDFAVSVDPERREAYQEALMFDLYRIEKSKSRPAWAQDLALEKKKTSRYLRAHGMEKKYCHLEHFYWLDAEGKYRKEGEPLWFLFDYETRNPLTNEAAITVITDAQMEGETA
ncbi:B12-binding domain-containing radical SAM protein [uncultured Eubacterium sp.]|uniref:B12-binding domain-containing radical SAM protein n=1 Tax=uncultured Eubacterium sp. TaxID=165185 RepID=UPI0025F27660|nr:B12-binding domain-containing radical SAM protein [uncultured Eubacterium sp.]